MEEVVVLLETGDVKREEEAEVLLEVGDVKREEDADDGDGDTHTLLLPMISDT